jgi:hypothetical protein
LYGFSDDGLSVTRDGGRKEGTREAVNNCSRTVQLQHLWVFKSKPYHLASNTQTCQRRGRRHYDPFADFR